VQLLLGPSLQQRLHQRLPADALVRVAVAAEAVQIRLDAVHQQHGLRPRLQVADCRSAGISPSRKSSAQMIRCVGASVASGQKPCVVLSATPVVTPRCGKGSSEETLPW